MNMGLAITFLAIAGSVQPLFANEHITPRRMAFSDWSVFIADSPHQCWIATKPWKRVVTFGKNTVEKPTEGLVLIVSLDKKSSSGVELSYYSGSFLDIKFNFKLEFSTQSFAMLKIGNSIYLDDRFNDGRIAEMLSYQEKIEGGLRIVSTKSNSGSVDERVEDIFSLVGFSKAFHEMEPSATGPEEPRGA